MDLKKKKGGGGKNPCKHTTFGSLLFDDENHYPQSSVMKAVETAEKCSLKGKVMKNSALDRLAKSNQCNIFLLYHSQIFPNVKITYPLLKTHQKNPSNSVVGHT